jgi:hypothetical protein
MDFRDERAAVLDTDEAAVSVVLWPGEAGERPIAGFYAEEYLAGLAQELGHGLAAQISLSDPSLVCQESDLAGVWQAGAQTPLRIDPAPGLGVAGGNYKVKERQPAGPGLALLLLEKV